MSFNDDFLLADEDSIVAQSPNKPLGNNLGSIFSSNGRKNINSKLCFTTSQSIHQALDLSKKLEIPLSKHCSWSVTSTKDASGISNLLHPDTLHYWQSDAQPPHLLFCQFYQPKYVSEIALNLKFSEDDSYTPQKIEIVYGTPDSLQVFASIQLDSPNGWFVFSLYDWYELSKMVKDHKIISEWYSNTLNKNPPQLTPLRHGIKTFGVGVRIMSNYSLGRDCRIRGVKLYQNAVSEQKSQTTLKFYNLLGNLKLDDDADSDDGDGDGMNILHDSNDSNKVVEKPILISTRSKNMPHLIRGLR